MGNQRFKLSDMMPNAWFYKLRDMSKVKQVVVGSKKKKKKHMQPAEADWRKSFYSNANANANTNTRNRKTVYMPSPSLSPCDDHNSDIIIDMTSQRLPPIHTASRNSFSAGVKIRRKKPQSRRRRNNKGMTTTMFHSESFAIVKASFDPEKDFKESMMEMILENNLTHSKDFEDLLACYLSLNSNQYHHIIINAFEQIWFTIF